MGFLSKLFGARSRPARDARLRLQEAEALGLRFKVVEVQANGHRYEVFTASSREKAIDCLRRLSVKEEGVYLAVETPEGNIGKDMIIIFDEQTQKMIEFGVRQPLPEMRKSRERCARCGYLVIPAGRPLSGVHYFITPHQMKMKGCGVRCGRCNVLWCAFCEAEASGPDVNGQFPCILCGEETRLHHE